VRALAEKKHAQVDWDRC